MWRMATLTPDNAATIVETIKAKKYGGIELEPVTNAGQDRGLAIGIYAPGGIGKTTLAATITDSELGSPALYLNARGNPHVVSSYGDRIQVVNITKFAQIERVRADLVADKDMPFKSVILDNVSEMFYMDLRDRYGPVGDVVWQKHSATTADVLQLVRNWMDLAIIGTKPDGSGPKLNVVFIFQETPEARIIAGKEVLSRSELAFNKALQFQVPTIVNFLGRLYITDGPPKYTRMLDFRPVEEVHQAKMQLDPEHPLTKAIPMQIYNPSLASILDTLRGNKPWPTAKHTKSSSQG